MAAGSARACGPASPSTSTRCSAGEWWIGSSPLPGSRPRPARRRRLARHGCCLDGDGIVVAVQEHARGTGDAVRCAREPLGGSTTCWCSPAIRRCSRLRCWAISSPRIARRRGLRRCLRFARRTSGEYGRIVRGADGQLAAIVEASDATPEQLEIREVNSSIYVFRATALWPALERLTPPTPRGSSTSPTPCASLRPPGNRSRCTLQAIRPRRRA